MAPRKLFNFRMLLSSIPGFCSLTIVCLVGATTLAPMAVAAQVQDSTGIKRAFLDRYLDCAEAPSAAARLECFDMLLIDIPAWLDEPSEPLYVSFQLPSDNAQPKRLEKKHFPQ
jgi:hypothetical protein